MVASLVVAGITIALMIFSVLCLPKIKIGRKIRLEPYYIVTLVGAAIFLIFGLATPTDVGRALTADVAVNPLKILALFLSMTVLSVFLDELGFFEFLAAKALARAKSKQTRLFFILYFTVSALTVFTSNDVIILAFTPFICYFTKSAKIDPIPYLAAEFVAANTWSMALVIGNPTNVYLASSAGIDFVTYLKYSIIPTVFAGVVSLGALFLIFRKSLRAPLTVEQTPAVLPDKPQLAIGLVHLLAATVLLAVGPYFGLEMWIAAVAAAGSLFVCTLVVSALRGKKPAALTGCIKRAPYSLIPFVLSMFVIISGLSENGVTDAIARLLGHGNTVLTYGISSFFVSNLVNNIPMSVLYSEVLGVDGAGTGAVMASVIGSNLGAFFSPIGALAGIMWSSMVGKNGILFGYLDFLKLGVRVAIPALLAALGGLFVSLAAFGV